MDEFKKLRALVEVVGYTPPCDDLIHRQGCKDCESPKAKARWEARRTLERLGFTNTAAGRTAARVYAAMGKGLDEIMPEGAYGLAVTSEEADAVEALDEACKLEAAI